MTRGLAMLVIAVAIILGFLLYNRYCPMAEPQQGVDLQIQIQP